MAARPSGWSGYCGSIFSSSGRRWPTRRWRTRSTTAGRCNASPASSSRPRACPTPPRCSSSAACSRPTTCAKPSSARSTPTSPPAACVMAQRRSFDQSHVEDNMSNSSRDCQISGFAALIPAAEVRVTRPIATDLEGAKAPAIVRCEIGGASAISTRTKVALISVEVHGSERPTNVGSTRVCRKEMSAVASTRLLQFPSFLKRIKIEPLNYRLYAAETNRRLFRTLRSATKVRRTPHVRGERVIAIESANEPSFEASS